jgi:hypothetical protein
VVHVVNRKAKELAKSAKETKAADTEDGAATRKDMVFEFNLAQIEAPKKKKKRRTVTKP